MKALAEKKEFLASIKDVGDAGKFEVVASSESVDRQGEIVMQEGIDIKNYMQNPVILFGHDYWSLPIGKATEIVRQAGKTVVRGVFASAEANPLAQQVRKLYEEGILKAVSIGFIPLEYNGNQITKSELLELSFVPVPANPEALSVLSLVKERGLEKEYAMVLKSMQKSGIKLSEPLEDFISEENKEEAIEKHMLAIKESQDKLKEAMREGNKLMANEIKSIQENLTEKLVELQGLVVKDDQVDDIKSARITEVLDDVQKKTQLIDTIVNQVNQKLKSVK
jgi:HK97 family phage prohead protease